MCVIYAFNYSFFILCIEFLVASMKTKFCWSWPDHMKSWVGLNYITTFLYVFVKYGYWTGVYRRAAVVKYFQTMGNNFSTFRWNIPVVLIESQVG